MTTPDPYRVLFPVGMGLGAVGASLWLFFAAGMLGFFPREAHGNLMYFGLMWSFVAGFLMTAVPKMTGGHPAHRLEIAAAALLALAQAVLSLRNLGTLSVALFAAQILFLVAFLLRRFLARPVLPFSGFVFLPAAFLQALLGAVLFLWSDGERRDLVVLLSGEAFLLNLILGIGSRLIPVISRLPNALQPDQSSAAETWATPLAVLVLLNGSYFMEAFGSSQSVVGAVRMAGVALASWRLLGLFTVPVSWSAVGVGLKAGLVFLLVGQAVRWGSPEAALAALHLTYIGGFVLITLLISTRVMLAHGGVDLRYEIAAPRIWAMVALTGFAALSRFLAGPVFTSPLVLASAALLLVVMALWLHKFLKILRGPAGPDQC